ncbi:tRNA1(Val) (adenine(37)-N6)-methyltransferase [Dongia sedimenti]|uniref:Methyltransferase n=1 Tax=Dongia sedimenti TaxID=3064282 RepID=A0ABU0YFD9_9PROT|nr:methyltransferase [Rhodospirillaceae bacterium R-7]
MDNIAGSDRLLGGRVKVAQPADGYRVAVDAVLLAAAVDAAPGAAVLDLGCGVGSVGLCLAWRRPDLSITGLDREPVFAACARANAATNGFSDRLQIIESDLRAPLPRKFDAVVMNPPYLKAGAATVSAHPLKAAATAESAAKLADWIAAARAALKPGGILTLIHRADRLDDVLGCVGRGFGGIAILPIHPKRDRAARRIILRAQLGSGEPMAILPGLVLHEEGGAFTAAADSVLRDGSALPMRAGLA